MLAPARDGLARLWAGIAIVLGAAALVLALESCGGSPGPAGPGGKASLGTPRMAIVSGDSQQASVGDTLPFDAVVQVTRDGSPVPQQLVDWHVDEENAGEPFVTTTQTDSQGVTRNRVVVGTWAWTRPEIGGAAHLEVRWIDQATGEAIVDTTIAYLVLPGAPTSVANGVIYAAQPSPFRIPAKSVLDQYGNPVPFITHGDSILTADSATLTFRAPGCGPITLTVADTAVLYGVVQAGGRVAFTFTPDSAAYDGFWHFIPSGDSLLATTLMMPHLDRTQNILYPCAQAIFTEADTMWRSR